MEFDVLFAGLAVDDFTVSRAWYERFFGRPPDVVAHDEEVMWQVTPAGWLYIVRDPDRAGTGRAAIAVPDMGAAIAALAARGVAVGPTEAQAGAGTKAVAVDPDGNSISVIQVTDGG